MQKRPAKVWLLRSLAGVLIIVLLALLAVWMYLRSSLPMLDGTFAAPGLHSQVTVARDARGVPLISGNNRADLAYATGFVHAQDRFFQMDLLRRVGAGELAELFGPKAVPLDRSHRMHRFRARATLALNALSAPDRAFLDRYVNGINDGLNALKGNPFEYALIGVKPRKWDATDSFLVVYAMYFDLQGKLPARELARGWLRENTTEEQRAFLLPGASRWDAALDDTVDAAVGERVPAIPQSAPPWWGRALNKESEASLASADFVDHTGSNNWALAGSRSESGAAIVANDMHLGLQLPNIWYRLALQFPDAQGRMRRVVGVTLPGALPTVVVGSNGRVAWGYTNSYGDYLDMIALDTDPAKPGQVRTPAGWETPKLHEEIILVKGEPANKLTVRETSLGPVQESDDRPYAVHWIAHGTAAQNTNPMQLETVDTLDEALAIATTMGIPAQNFIGGDDKGNIGWTIAGLMPRRAQTGEGTTFPIPSDGSFPTFDGTLAPGQHPRLVNPPSGQLSTANNRQLAGSGAEIIGDGGFDVGARNQQVRDGLLALGPRAGLDAVHAIALDDRALFIAPWRGRAIKVLDAAALKGHPLRAEFLVQLTNSWTGRASVDSVGYRLARQYMWSMHDMLYGAVNVRLSEMSGKPTMALVTSRWPLVIERLLDEQPAGWLPRGHADWRSVQLAAIDHAIAEVTKEDATLASATWGARNTAAIAHPIAQAVPLLKPLLAPGAAQLAGDANMPRVAGPKFGQSERMTVSPGKEEQGVFNMPGGQSGHPLSPFFLNGHSEWADGTPAPLLPGPAKHTLTFVK